MPTSSIARLATLVALTLLPATAALAQSVGIGTTTPNPAAALEVSSTTQGLLLPRLTLAQRDALTASTTAPPVPGLVIYQTTNTPGLYAYDGTTWVRLGADNLGNHTATQNLNLQGNALTGSGASISGVGVGVRADGGLNLGQNTQGQNMLLGFVAGSSLSSGIWNVALGPGSGQRLTTGSANTLTGYQSGTYLTSGSNNVLAGNASGIQLTTADNNTFNGHRSGFNTTLGGNNTFVGALTGMANVTGSSLTALGYGSGPATDGLTNATALGYNAQVGQSNSLVLGGTGAGAVSVGIGTTTPNAAAALDITAAGKGLLIPRLDSATRAAIASPPAGLLVYQTTNRTGFWYYTGTAWAFIPDKLRSGDNLGNHTATQNLNLQGNALTGTGASISGVGVGVRADGGLNLGQAGNGNVLLGYVAGAALTSGSQNVLVGPGSGQSLTSGNQNTFTGYQSGGATLGSRNTFLGNQSGRSTSFGEENTFVGAASGFSNTTGGQNTFVGTFSGHFNNAGGANAFFGYFSGYNNTGNNNTFVGHRSGLINTTGNYNTFVGTSSGYNNSTGTGNTFGGYQSGYNNGPGHNNTFLGYQSGRSNTADDNTFLGYASGLNNSTGTGNAFSGFDSGFSNTTGNYNTFSGHSSGLLNSTGSGNVFTGNNSGNNNTTGGNNVFNGFNSGGSNTTGSSNIFSGYQSGYNTTTGSSNVFVGDQAGTGNITGTYNTALGAGSGPASGSGALTNATAVGANVSLTTSNTVVLGNNANVGIGTTAPAAGLHVVSGNGGVASGSGALLSGAANQPPNLELRGGTSTTPYVDFAETSDVDYSTRLLSQNGTLRVYGTPATGSPALQVNGATSADGSVIVDAANLGDGTTATNLLRLGGATSGEGLGSKRTGGGNQYGLDFYTASQPRLSVDVNGRVGVGTTAPNSPLQVTGAVALPHLQANADLTLTDAHYTVRCASGCTRLTLPDAVGRQGRLYVLVNSYNYNTAVTLTTQNGQLVYDDTTGQNLLALPARSRLTIQSDGGNWVVLSR